MDICVTATGFPSSNNVTSCAATVSGLSNTPANWSIGAADISTSGTSGTINISWPAINSATVYSNKAIILPASNRQVTVKLTTFRANNNTNYDNKVSVTTAARQFVKGGYYRITLKVEQNSIPGCTYNWAKANLKSSGVFESSQTAYGGYFGWNTTSTSTGVYNGGNYSTANDPCYQVAPKGTWYTPSSDQLTNLMNCNRSGWENGWYFASRAIFLPAGGFRYGGGALSSVGESGLYWSRTPYGDYGYGLYFNSNGYIGIDYRYRNRGLSVRCVKGM